MPTFDKQITFVIAASGGWTPPYSVPASGQALAIGTNTANSVQPASGNWGYSLFNSYGGGTFVSDYSQGGAFVIAGTGGHNAPDNTGACIFDFADATWKYRSNGNGVAVSLTPIDVSATTGTPYYEVSGTQVPAPAHLYTASARYISSALGGGTKGSYLLFMQIATTVQSRVGLAIHKMDLSTGVWSRVTNNTVSFSYGSLDGEFMSVHDTVLNRWYAMHPAIHTENRFPYLDSADWTVKFTPTFAYPSDPTGSGTWASMTFDPVRRAMLYFKDNMPLMAVDTQNFAAGWQTLTYSGGASRPPNNQCRWEYYPVDGCFYTRNNNSGNTLYKLTPPAGGTLAGTWAFSTVTVGGASMPNFTNAGGNNTAHYTCFFYVPALQCFAWVPGEASSIYLVKP